MAPRILASILLFGALVGCSCEDDIEQRETADASEPSDKIPDSLEEAVNLLMTEMPEDVRQSIIAMGEEYASMSHFSSGMGMRNGWGLWWGESPLARHFARLGIYHADDRSAMINTAVSRRVRGKPIDVEGLVKYYRDYWAEEDIVAPLDLACPHCRKEMVIGYIPEAEGRPFPERVYFSGVCPEGVSFAFYHKDGWKPADTINGEQDAADQLPARIELKSE